MGHSQGSKACHFYRPRSPPPLRPSRLRLPASFGCHARRRPPRAPAAASARPQPDPPPHSLLQRGGKYPYNHSTVPFLSELLKLVISAGTLLATFQRSPRTTAMTTDWASLRLFPIPSVIYAVHNNIQFATMSYVDAATYQILGNLKIVSTGLLFRLALGRRLSRSQWMALLLLTLGATTSQISGCGSDGLLSAPPAGYLLGVLSACLSATAGVYTEAAPPHPRRRSQTPVCPPRSHLPHPPSSTC